MKILYANRDSHTQWIGFIDDDTFVTSMSALTSALDNYDSSKQWYLGALPEEWWTVVLYGDLIAMGGGGIFLSLSLAAILAANYDDCATNSRRGFGDHKIFECISRHTSTPLTLLQGLYQIDIHGDRSGLYESGRQILTLHHWKEGYWDERGDGPDGIRHAKWFPLDEMSLVASICDTCFLQRWQFGDDTILSNGYSISGYPTGSERMGLEKMEYTWVTPMVVEGSRNPGWDHYVGPLRPPIPLEEHKVPYRFLKGVRQYYRHLGKGGRWIRWWSCFGSTKKRWAPVPLGRDGVRIWGIFFWCKTASLQLKGNVEEQGMLKCSSYIRYKKLGNRSFSISTLPFSVVDNPLKKTPPVLDFAKNVSAS